MRIPHNVTLESFKLEHIDEMRLREYDHKSVEYLKDAEVVQVFMKGPAITVRVNGVIAGSGGFAIPWPGRAEAWLLTTPLIARYPKLAFSLAKHYLSMAPSMGFTRIETAIAESHHVARRWLKRLGFTEESLMRRFGPNGQNFVRYVIIPDKEPR
jgi:hypothetical protein